MSEKSSKIKRRDFVKLAGAAALAGPSLNVLGANERVRVACVGYSDRFRGSLLPCFMQHQKELNFDLVAVADLWKKRLYENAKPDLEKKLGHAVTTYTSDIDLYENAKDVDAVIISTADFQHAQHAQHAVVAGKDAYCEKPLAEDMYSVNLLKDAVDAKRNAGFAPGAVLQIGSQRRSGVAYHAAKEFIDSKQFGDISYVDLRWNVNQPKRWRRPEALIASLKKEDIDWNMWLLDRDPDEYKFDPRKYLEFRLFWPFSSGTPGQWMCHQIDTVAWFMGYPYPKSAVSSGARVRRQRREGPRLPVRVPEPPAQRGRRLQAERRGARGEVLRAERLHRHGPPDGDERGRRAREVGGEAPARAEGARGDERQHGRRQAHLRAHAQLDGVRPRAQEPERAH